MRLVRRLMVLLALSLTFGLSVHAAGYQSISHPVDLFEFDSVAQQKQAIHLAKTLRCPMCQNQNLIESNSAVAKDIRLRVFELVKAGKSDSEVKEYMVARYGEHVLYQPSFSMKNALLWGIPIVLGLFMIGFSIGHIKRSIRGIH
ncbi:cytochrome c-type biogenesis protein CcmH [Vibrio breoganii]|uniref:cytochrome c-type biogenesis protein n=1 Tax=Vibrio breoganii TaxID=553239 RepID=UPI00080DC0BA|nr:cytochrome c-type biogenesis protein [Vibrio breoganii]MDN3716602.1 cytochrome c-type biogenesis protein CcmH [Vibrio breoganii]OCH77428.1 cytochrome C nitrite reductase [Vibrio breoganii]PMG90733.1 cytochrome C nitrite reductase [Vibrio breoganii]PML30169.1 cytochrome C nitrite reductase [Vibrio breoganii]PML35921.1 cytochrome C nitrite reductase [Vibrio breoganii]